eukprot:TRINITY_DN730_c0_g1_i1.p1 TRINITY_DN730_c0_g1~~TRINITY_DN730_c0_g1_i1.p1  ORF type:complete len:156 (+),score=27.50 TRINITY_DN730_c0_g1_i1:105-572(+)
MYPLSLLKASKDKVILLELKNGETINGTLKDCDPWMNINLRDVVLTSRDGTEFWTIPECYIRGNMIKYIRVSDEVIDSVQDEEAPKKSSDRGRGRGRGGPSNRGRGRGGLSSSGKEQSGPSDAGSSAGRGAPRGRGQYQGGRGREGSDRGRGRGM